MGKRYTQESIIDRFRELHGDKYDYSRVVFKTVKDKVIIMCSYHGEFKITPDNHMHRNGGCPRCRYEKAGDKMRGNNIDVMDKFTAIHGNKYIYPFQNPGFNREIEIICRKHGSFYQRVGLHIKGAGCPECAIEKNSSNQRHTLDYFIEKAKLVHGEIYDYSKAIYVNSDTPVEIICPHHGSFFSSPYNHTKKNKPTKCPHCNESHGERKIAKLLDRGNIEYERQKKMNGCKVLRDLKFDFYLPKQNVLIEYNGIQHYEPVEHFGGTESFFKTAQRDEAKQQYATLKGYDLIVISYKDNIKEKLAPILK